MAASAATDDLMGGDDGTGNAGGPGGKADGGAAGGNASSGGAEGAGADGKVASDNPASGDGADDDLLGDDGAEDDKSKKADDKGGKTEGGKAGEPYTIEVPKELAEFADKEALTEFTKLANEQKLTKAQADAIAKQSFERAKSQREAIEKQLADASKEWFNEIKNDKEIGGDNIPATKQDIAMAIKKYGPEGFVKAMKSFGGHNFPPLVRFIAAVGKDLRPDGGKIKGGKNGNAETETHDQMLARLYNTD